MAVAVAVAATAAVEAGGNAKERLRCEAGSDAGGGGRSVHGSGGGGYGACHYTLAGGVRVPRNLLSLPLPSLVQTDRSFLSSFSFSLTRSFSRSLSLFHTIVLSILIRNPHLFCPMSYYGYVTSSLFFYHAAVVAYVVE